MPLRCTVIFTDAGRLVRTAMLARRLRDVADSAVTAGSGQPSLVRAGSFGQASSGSIRPCVSK